MWSVAAQQQILVNIHTVVYLSKVATVRAHNVMVHSLHCPFVLLDAASISDCACHACQQTVAVVMHLQIIDLLS